MNWVRSKALYKQCIFALGVLMLFLQALCSPVTGYQYDQPEEYGYELSEAVNIPLSIEVSKVPDTSEIVSKDNSMFPMNLHINLSLDSNGRFLVNGYPLEVAKKFIPVEIMAEIEPIRDAEWEFMNDLIPISSQAKIMFSVDVTSSEDSDLEYMKEYIVRQLAVTVDGTSVVQKETQAVLVKVSSDGRIVWEVVSDPEVVTDAYSTYDPSDVITTQAIKDGYNYSNRLAVPTVSPKARKPSSNSRRNKEYILVPLVAALSGVGVFGFISLYRRITRPKHMYSDLSNMYNPMGKVKPEKSSFYDPRSLLQRDSNNEYIALNSATTENGTYDEQSIPCDCCESSGDDSTIVNSKKPCQNSNCCNKERVTLYVNLPS